MAESIGIIQPVQKVVFRNEGDEWAVEGFALIFQDQDGKYTKMVVEIRGKDFREIPNGARIVGIDYAPRIQVSVSGRKTGADIINLGRKIPDIKKGKS